MKTNTLLKWLVLPASTFVLIGCGGGSSSSAVAATGQAFYVDSAVEGLDYSCGSLPKGKTGPNGEFTFEKEKGCTFSLDTIKLRDIAADKLKDGKQIQETNVEIARVLLSLDHDRNFNNGITIDSDIVGALVDASISNFADILTEWSSLIPVEWPGAIFSHLVSESKAKVHLVKNILQKHSLYTNMNISGENNMLAKWTFNADFSSVSVEIEGGVSDSESVSVHFDEGSLTFSTTNHGNIVKIKNITDEYLLIAINGDETRLYYDEAKARAYFLN